MGKRERIFSVQAFRQNYDIYSLIAFAALFSILGFLGLTGPDILGSVTLGALAVIAFSQVRIRFQVEDVAKTWHRARTEILVEDFPKEYDEAQKSVSKTYFYTGETMVRTMSHMRTEFPRIFANGGSVKILLPNPKNDQLMEAIAKTRSDRGPSSIRADIENSFRLAEECRTGNNDIQLRTTDVMPHMGINGLDIKEPSGKIMVQMYEYKSTAPERGPIFLLEANDRDWFKRFSDQIDRLWEDGNEYVPVVTTSK